MKLLLCLDCSDIFSLTRREKKCNCGNTSGQYIDRVNAEISGNCIPIGFSNKSFKMALLIQAQQNALYDKNMDIALAGERFEAFIIPHNAKSIKRIK